MSFWCVRLQWCFLSLPVKSGEQAGPSNFLCLLWFVPVLFGVWSKPDSDGWKEQRGIIAGLLRHRTGSAAPALVQEVHPPASAGMLLRLNTRFESQETVKGGGRGRERENMYSYGELWLVVQLLDVIFLQRYFLLTVRDCVRPWAVHSKALVLYCNILAVRGLFTAEGERMVTSLRKVNYSPLKIFRM